MEIQKVIEIIRALTTKTVAKGCTEAEAFAAAAKVGELLKVYNLSIDKVFLGEVKCITVAIDTGRIARHPIDFCVVAIAEFCDCKIWFQKNKKYVEENGIHTLKKGNSIYNLFGLETDVAMAQYLYGIILDAVENETEQFKKTDVYQNSCYSRKNLTNSFQRSMARRIGQRLNEMKIQRHQEEKEVAPVVAGEKTSLIVIKNNKVEDEFKQLNMKFTRHISYNRIVNAVAARAGEKAAEKVNLSRPVGGRTVGLLK